MRYSYFNIMVLLCLGLSFLGCSQGKSSTADASAIDTSTQVLAKNVLIEKAGNKLISNDLQSALDDELAINLSEYLPGTTWTIKNKAGMDWFRDTTGQLTFSSGSFSLDQGKFAAADIPDKLTICTDTPPFSYEIISDSVIYLTYNINCVNAGPTSISRTLTVAAKNKNNIILVGFNGYISILTRVQ